MSEMEKQYITQAVIEALEPFANAVQTDFKEVKNILGSVEGRLGSVEGRLGSVEGRLGSVEDRLGSVEADVVYMKENFSELFTKLDKFVDLYEAQKQELLVLNGIVE